MNNKNCEVIVVIECENEKLCKDVKKVDVVVYKLGLVEK